MKDRSTSVKPFTYASPQERKAKVFYTMAIRGLKPDGLHKLLGYNPTQSMLSRVMNGNRKSAPLEERIAVVLGVTREELFGDKPLELWRAA